MTTFSHPLDTDVFIIGGGPAGLAAGIAARQHGFAVVVADGAIPPIDKPCGEGLMPDGIAALAGWASRFRRKSLIPSGASGFSAQE